MIGKRRFCFYFFCVLIGSLVYFQQTDGNDINSSLTGDTTGNGIVFFFYQRPTYPRDCKEVLDQYPGTTLSGVFEIKPDGYPEPFEVYCNNSFDSSGWTVFMRRLDGSLVFKRNWAEYKEGFGFLSSEFWLGNEKLSFLTNQRKYELRIDVMIYNGGMVFTTYGYFRVNDEWGNYSLVSAEGNDGNLTWTCPGNMLYTTCACERTCEAPNICQNDCQDVKRCICPAGFFKRGSECVVPVDCECFSTTADKVIPAGEFYINDQCSERCSCSESGLICSDYGCNLNARCTITSDGGRCSCNAGFLGDGLDCRCPTNMIYTTCGCERTCEAPHICQNNCEEAERCICPEGFFLRGSDCVTPEDCECYSTAAGKVIPIGESYINNQCSSRCSCSESGLICSNYGCDPNARCTSSSGGGWCACNAGFFGNGLNCRCSSGYLVDGSICRRPRDCDEVPSVTGYSGSNSYYILPSTWRAFWVYCNMSEGRWTVFQRRIKGSGRDFAISWNDYKRGFGELDEDFWLGNEKIHYLTSQRNYQLRIDIIDSENRHYRAYYNGFRTGSEGDSYRMTVLGTYSGNAGYDALRYHFNQPFRTHDRDVEFSTCPYYFSSYHGNCAILHQGGWWYKYRTKTSTGGCDRRFYKSCDYYFSSYSNLNGKEYGDGGETIFWHGLLGNDCGIKYTEMKIRPLL